MSAQAESAAQPAAPQPASPPPPQVSGLPESQFDVFAVSLPAIDFDRACDESAVRATEQDRTFLSVPSMLAEQQRGGSIPGWRALEQEISILRPNLIEEIPHADLKDYILFRFENLLRCSLRLAGRADEDDPALHHRHFDHLIEARLVKLVRTFYCADAAAAGTDQSTRVAPPSPAPKPLSGLALSGGGIRSGTLALGVLQALAAKGRLSKFDYLSTVSGGGYTGSWLKAWIHRLTLEFDQRLRDPTRIASPLPPVQAVAQELTTRPDSATVRRLREYSNFLSPRLGAFSADTWTLISLALRNLILNWIMFIPLALLTVAVPWTFFITGARVHEWARTNTFARWSLLGGGIVAFFVALFFTTSFIAQTQLFKPDPSGRLKPRGVTQGRFVLCCGLPLVIGAILISLASPAQSIPDRHRIYVYATLAISTAIAAAINSREQKFRWSVAGLLSGATFGAVLIGSHMLVKWGGENVTSMPWLFSGLWLSVPLALFAGGMAATVFIGLSSTLKDATDLLHEWWARFGGWMLLVSMLWLAGIILTIVLPKVILSIDESTFDGAKKALAAGGGFIGVATALLGFFDSSSPTDSKRPSLSARFRALLLPIGAALFAIAVLVGSAITLLWIMDGAPSRSFDAAYPLGLRPADSWDSPLVRLLIATGILLVVLLVAARLINYSRFTLHALYRERLVRAYLGASNTARNPDRFTGFDPEDNIRLHELRGDMTRPEFIRPFHILNMTLNLTSSSRLDWQERKGESFTASMLHAGTRTLGYQDIQYYAGPARFGTDNLEHTGMTLGGAVAASGAAASPNMGFNSSPLVAFLLTVFNIRLGVWLPNPGRTGEGVHIRSGPKWALHPALSELVGTSDDTSPYVNITDGGHFDNMGMYELVRRGLRVIVCIDGECDNVDKGAPFVHEGLAQSIRKCAIDLGVEIRSEPPTENVKWNEVLCPNGYWLARIHYPGDALIDPRTGKGDPGDLNPEPGYLLYIKPILFGDLPVDLRNYHASNPDFPQQSTADQWFSESQFESYRKLGALIANEIPADVWRRIGLA